MHPTTCSPQVYQVEERELLEVPLIVITVLTAFLSLKVDISENLKIINSGVRMAQNLLSIRLSWTLV